MRLLFLLLVFTSSVCQAQQPYLVKDVVPDSLPSFRFDMAWMHGKECMYVKNYQLWKSNSTTSQVNAIQENVFAVPAYSPLYFNGYSVYWSRLPGDTVCSIWTTDGTNTGTKMLRPKEELWIKSYDTVEAVVLGKWLVFKAISKTHGAELWVTNGKSDSTFLLKDIFPGLASSRIKQLKKLGSKAVFLANNGANGMEYWQTDGTVAGTSMIADLFSGSGGITPTQTIYSDTAFAFLAKDLAGQEYIYRSIDQKLAAFKKLNIELPYINLVGFQQNRILITNNYAYLKVLDEATNIFYKIPMYSATSAQVLISPSYFKPTYIENEWENNATPQYARPDANLYRLDVFHFESTLMDSKMFRIKSTINTYNDGLFKGKYYLYERRTTTATDLRAIDKSTGIAFTITSFSKPANSYTVSLEGVIATENFCYVISSHSGYTLQVMDAVSPNANLVPVSHFKNIRQVVYGDGDNVFLVADENFYLLNGDKLTLLKQGYEKQGLFNPKLYPSKESVYLTEQYLYESDGNTVSVVDSTSPNELVISDHSVLYNNNRLGITYRYSSGIKSLFQPDLYSLSQVGEHNGHLYVYANSQKLYLVNPALKTFKLDSISGDCYRGCYSFTYFNHKQYVLKAEKVGNDSTRYAFCEIDTVQGKFLSQTYLPKGLMNSYLPYAFKKIIIYQGRLYCFVRTNDGVQAFLYEESNKSFEARGHVNAPVTYNLDVIAGEEVFVSTGGNGDVYRYNTIAGTFSKSLARARSTVNDHAQLILYKGNLYFFRENFPKVSLSYIPQGSTDVIDLKSFIPTSLFNTAIDPYQLIVFNDLLYFTATEPLTGGELWQSDGTLAGTKLVSDINPGPASSEISGMTATDNHLFFIAKNKQYGTELWALKKNGTVTGMEEVLAESSLDYVLQPNPAQQDVTLSSPGNAKFSFEIYDINGGIISNGTGIRSIKIPVQGYVPGLYIVRISAENGSTSKSLKLLIR